MVDVPGVTATADTRSEVLNLIREQLGPLWKSRRIAAIGLCERGRAGALRPPAIGG